MPSRQEVLDLKQERRTEIRHCEKLQDRADRESRDLTPEEQQAYDGHWARQTTLKRRIELGEADLEIEGSRSTPAPPDSASEEDQPETRAVEFTPEQVEFRHLVRSRFPHLAPQLDNEDGIRDVFTRSLMAAAGAEVRMTVGDEVSGGILKPTMSMVQEIIQGLNTSVFVRQFARRFVTTMGTSLGVVKKTRRGNAFKMGTEISTADIGKGPGFEGRKFTPHAAIGALEISKDLLKGAISDPEEILREELDEEASALQEVKFWTGSGNGEPLGILTKSKHGITAERDVPAGDAEGHTIEGLYDAKFKLRERYRQSTDTRWCWPGEELKTVAMLKHEGKPAWSDSLQLGEPDRLLGIAVHEVETWGSSTYSSAICNFRYYWIVDGLDLTFEVLREIRALNNKLVVLARLGFDGTPVLEEPFVRTTRTAAARS